MIVFDLTQASHHPHQSLSQVSEGEEHLTELKRLYCIHTVYLNVESFHLFGVNKKKLNATKRVKKLSN